MDILQEIYYTWEYNCALGKLKNDNYLNKKELELENLTEEFFKTIESELKDKNTILKIKKMFEDISDAQTGVSDAEQNIYFVGGFKEGVKFILSCFE